MPLKPELAGVAENDFAIVVLNVLVELNARTLRAQQHRPKGALAPPAPPAVGFAVELD
jgi:hypothetical protein